MKAYLFSGLGADKRIFQKIVLPAGYEVVFIAWILPEVKETLKDYCLRIAAQISFNEPFIFIGVSFGGIVATELSKIAKPQKLILISSISTHYELPFYYKWAGKLNLLALIPTKLLKSANIFTYYFFGAATKEEKELLKNILYDTDEVFLKWALHAILTWQNIEKPTNFWHLHANNDKILPTFCIKDYISFQSGGHFLVYNQSQKVNTKLAAIL
jgi:hypothetical protein